jgi:multidrug efflux pump subunit AcrB
LVVGITIPLVLAVTFLAMYYFGIGLHKISLGSLIIALGLLVDDAIIAVEMMVRKMEEGYDKVRSATFAYELTAMPMLTGTLITATGFLPIGMAKSVTGEYTFAIFAVTVLALLISWVASVYFVPYLGAWLLKSPAHAQQGATLGEPHELFDTPFYNQFRRTVNWCVAHRWITIGLTVLMFALGIMGMGKVQQQFFPDSSRPEILVDLWLPEGATVARRHEHLVPAVVRAVGGDQRAHAIGGALDRVGAVTGFDGDVGIAARSGGSEDGAGRDPGAAGARCREAVVTEDVGGGPDDRADPCSRPDRRPADRRRGWALPAVDHLDATAGRQERARDTYGRAVDAAPEPNTVCRTSYR